MKKMWLKRNGIPLILLFALAGSMVWTGTSILSTKKPTPVQQADIVVTPDYEITTTKEMVLWPAGSKLEQGNAAYFYAARPMLQAAPDIKVNGLDSGTLNGTIHTYASLQAINDKGAVYWSHKLSQLPQQAFSLSQTTAGFKAESISLDVAAINEMATKISEELKFQTGIIQLTATFDIQIDGTVNGVTLQKSITASLPVVLQQISFSAPRAKEVSTSLSLIPAETKPTMLRWAWETINTNQISFASDAALILALFLSLLLRRKSTVKAAMEHKKYKEWITEGSVEVKDRLRINIVKLEGLVDLAIDLDKRIIYDSKIKKYFVLADDIAYIHDPDQANRVMDNKQQLGKLLLARGLIRPEQLETGLYYQQRLGARLGESLLALGFVDETSLFGTLAAQQNVGYYELGPEDPIHYTEWADKLNLKKARALQALPLGKRADGKMIIACSEPAKEAVSSALQEVFGNQILLVAARPSAIYEAIERLEAQEKSKAGTDKSTNHLEPWQRLTIEEMEQCKAAYYRGSIPQGLLLKASGLADPITLSQAPEHEPLTNWLVNRNAVSSEVANLLKGLEEAATAIGWKERQDKRIPELLELLHQSNYVTLETVEWARQETGVQRLSTAELLQKNHIAAGETLRLAELLLHTLDSILKR